jgi:Na+-translocating ferredoxin:NAD+ oxidoreductase RnfC subunit
MQSLGFAESPAAIIAGTLYCCECNLCTMYACPEDLDPKNVCAESKPAARANGLFFTGSPKSVTPHPMAEFRRVPMARLISRLGLSEYSNTGPFSDHAFSPARVSLPLKQHAGVPSIPVIRTGDRVRPGDLLAIPPDGKLGARVHASIAGTARLTHDSVVIDA